MWWEWCGMLGLGWSESGKTLSSATWPNLVGSGGISWVVPLRGPWGPKGGGWLGGCGVDGGGGSGVLG